MSNTDTISGVVSTFGSGLSDQLWAVAPEALLVTAILFGVPLGVRFFKKLAK